MKNHKKARRIIAVTMAVLLAACSFIETGTGYVYATEADYSVEESTDSGVTEPVLDFDAGTAEEPDTTESVPEEPASAATEGAEATEPEIVPEEIPSTEAAAPDTTTEEEPVFTGEFVYVDETGLSADTITGEDYTADRGDQTIHALGVGFAGGSFVEKAPVYDGNGGVLYEGPMVIYAFFGEAQTALSLFCVDCGTSALGGDPYETTNEDAYVKLCREQKVAISYVLGSSAGRNQAPTDGKGSFNTGIDRSEWNRYYSTQLMIWYYIQEKNNGTSPNHGISWAQVEDTCNHGFGDLDVCRAIKEQVDGYYQVPSFAKDTRLGNAVPTPAYELTYNAATHQYETTLTNTNTACDLTNFYGAEGTQTTATVGGVRVTVTRTGAEQIKITANGSIKSNDCLNTVYYNI